MSPPHSTSSDCRSTSWRAMFHDVEGCGIEGKACLQSKELFEHSLFSRHSRNDASSCDDRQPRFRVQNHKHLISKIKIPIYLIHIQRQARTHRRVSLGRVSPRHVSVRLWVWTLSRIENASRHSIDCILVLLTNSRISSVYIDRDSWQKTSVQPARGRRIANKCPDLADN